MSYYSTKTRRASSPFANFLAFPLANNLRSAIIGGPREEVRHG
jgi:hypothetical protein